MNNVTRMAALLLFIGTIGAACIDIDENTTGNVTYTLNATSNCYHTMNSNISS